MICNILDEKSVRLNVQTRRLKGTCSTQQIGQVILLLLDHLMTEFTSLNSSRYKEDKENACTAAATSHHLKACYNVRMCQRDTIARWRHTVCRRYNIASEHVEPNATYANFLLSMEMEGLWFLSPKLLLLPSASQCLMASRRCRQCGRTIKLKVCSKCKAIRYCCRDHQSTGWKVQIGRRVTRLEGDPSLAD